RQSKIQNEGGIPQRNRNWRCLRKLSRHGGGWGRSRLQPTSPRESLRKSPGGGAGEAGLTPATQLSVELSESQIENPKSKIQIRVVEPSSAPPGSRRERVHTPSPSSSPCRSDTSGSHAGG